MKFDLKESINILDRTPQVLTNLLSGLPKEWINNNEGKDTWSPFDIIGHLIHGEKTDWMPRLKIILSEAESKQFIPFDRFAQFEHSKGKSIDHLLKEFAQLRKQNLKELKSINITESTLEMTGIHPEFGAVTLTQLLSTWVIHDLSHINQITRVMAKNYKEEAGPWKRYISIIKD